MTCGSGVSWRLCIILTLFLQPKPSTHVCILIKKCRVLRGRRNAGRRSSKIMLIPTSIVALFSACFSCRREAAWFLPVKMSSRYLRTTIVVVPGRSYIYPQRLIAPSSSSPQIEAFSILLLRAHHYLQVRKEALFRHRTNVVTFWLGKCSHFNRTARPVRSKTDQARTVIYPSI